MKTKIKGFTLIEMITTVVIAGSFSIGLFYLLLNSHVSIRTQDHFDDVKKYATYVIDTISEKIRSADEVSINFASGATVITITNIISGDENETFEYTVINNMVHENGQELKRPTFQEKWLKRNDLYDVDITLNCSDDNLSFYDTDDENLRDSVYDLDIVINLESKINNFQIEHKTDNRIFLINKFAAEAGKTNNS